MSTSKKTALVVMAAGIGSRYGKGIKQLEPVGPSGEIIMDYSIFDAIEAGFNQIVFIIRRDIADLFEEAIGKRVRKAIGTENVFCVYQERDDLPQGVNADALLANRTKPWGTGQAVLCCKDVVKVPFAVINADDYYGKEAFRKVHDYLVEHAEEHLNYCMAGFILANTLSDNGSVTRGICTVDAEDNLTGVVEQKNIIKTASGAEANGNAINVDSHVSMNMWGLTPDFLDVLEKGFREFLLNLKPEDTSAEYLLPIIIGGMLERGEVRVKVLETCDKWFGVTYAADKEAVMQSLRALTDSGVYPEKLFA